MSEANKPGQDVPEEERVVLCGANAYDKKYYFNEKGIQQNGWQKIKGDYYFFQIRNGCYALSLIHI